MYIYFVVEMYFIQLHSVSRTQQGRQRELCVNALPFPFSAEFWSGRTQRRALPRHQSEEMEI